VVFLPALALLVCAAGNGGAEAALSLKVLWLFETPERRTTLLDPERVEAFRVVSRSEPGRMVDGVAVITVVRTEGARFAGYRIKKRLGAIKPSLAKRLAAALLDGHTYPPPIKCPPGEGCAEGKGCSFEPGVGFHFVPKGQGPPIDVLLCFECDDVGVVRNRESERCGFLVNREDTTCIQTTDMAPGRSRLLRVVKEIFRQDEEIQSLPQKGT
jgi:hypothetical protein